MDSVILRAKMGPLDAAVPGEARVLRPILLLIWRIRAAVPVLVPLMACTGWRQLAKHNHVGPLHADSAWPRPVCQPLHANTGGKLYATVYNLVSQHCTS